MVISRCGHSVDGLDRNSGHVHLVLLVASEVAGIARLGRSAGLILPGTCCHCRGDVAR